MRSIILTALLVVYLTGCKPAAPPENPLAAQRAAMKKASGVEGQLQQQSEQRAKAIDETK